MKECKQMYMQNILIRDNSKSLLVDGLAGFEGDT